MGKRGEGRVRRKVMEGGGGEIVTRKVIYYFIYINSISQFKFCAIRRYCV